MSGEVEREEDAVEDGGSYLVIEYEDDPVDSYNTRRLAIGLGLAFLFGFIFGTLVYLGRIQPDGVGVFGF
jgi:hypothetical protein